MATEFCFDTVYLQAGPFGVFCFQSQEFPIRLVFEARDWIKRNGAGDAAVCICVNDEYAVIRSFFTWNTREAAERNMTFFLDTLKRA